MNERIRELAKRAGFIFWEDYADTMVDGGSEFHPVFVKKFAELIIRECCKKLEDDGMVEVAMEIKGHFGVQ